MVQLAIPAWPKWILTGLTALALVVGLGDSLSLNMTSVAVAQDELPEENAPVEDVAEPAPDNNENAVAAADAAAGELAAFNIQRRKIQMDIIENALEQIEENQLANKKIIILKNF